MGLIVISDLFCFDVVVRRVGTNEADINNLKFVLHRYHEPIRIPLDVEYNTVVTKNALFPRDEALLSSTVNNKFRYCRVLDSLENELVDAEA
jgi:hypothetical protein